MMNREIKFRAIHEGSNKMVYGNLIKGTFEGKPFTQIEHSDSDDFYQWHFKTETVGQFTGLKDKNGVEIYFDDIIRFKGNYTEEAKCGYFIAKVDFDGFKIVLKSGDLEWDARGETEGFDYTCEVIGNIHQNPELL